MWEEPKNTTRYVRTIRAMRRLPQPRQLRLQPTSEYKDRHRAQKASRPTITHHNCMEYPRFKRQPYQVWYSNLVLRRLALTLRIYIGDTRRKQGVSSQTFVFHSNTNREYRTEEHAWLEGPSAAPHQYPLSSHLHVAHAAAAGPAPLPMPDERRLPSLLRNVQRDGRRRSEKILRGSSVKGEHLAPEGIKKLHRSLADYARACKRASACLPPKRAGFAAAAVNDFTRRYVRENVHKYLHKKYVAGTITPLQGNTGM